MRNLSADLTRFVPTTLKVKKDMPPKKDMVKPSVNPHIEWRTPQVQVPLQLQAVNGTYIIWKLKCSFRFQVNPRQ